MGGGSKDNENLKKFSSWQIRKIVIVTYLLNCQDRKGLAYESI